MNLIKKQTEADLMRLKSITNEQLIMALFDLTEQAYCDLQFDLGLTYAKRMTCNDVIGFDFLVKTKFYWAWWRNQWASRDAEFIDTYSATADQAMLYDQYLFQHNVHRLKTDSLMQKKAVSMIGHAMDEYVKENKREAVK